MMGVWLVAVLALAAGVNASSPPQQQVFAGGSCSTMVQCGGEEPKEVKTITTTIPGFNPTHTVTIFGGTSNGGNGRPLQIITMIEPAGVEHLTVTSTLTNGQTTVEPPAPGQLGIKTVYVYDNPPQDARSTITITTTLPGVTPTTRITAWGPSPPPGSPFTLLIVPSQGEGPSNQWTCPCPNPADNGPKTVTITSYPSLMPISSVSTTTSVKDDGSTVTETSAPASTEPASKFPKSPDPLHPCRGTQLKAWTKFYVYWRGSYPIGGPPEPATITSNYDYDSVFTVTDDEYQAEHWEIKLDGQKIGETFEDGWKNDKMYCSTWDADACISKGYSHGSFFIPKGRHEISVQWTKGPFKTDAGVHWWYGSGQYRSDRLCE